MTDDERLLSNHKIHWFKKWEDHVQSNDKLSNQNKVNSLMSNECLEDLHFRPWGLKRLCTNIINLIDKGWGKTYCKTGLALVEGSTVSSWVGIYSNKHTVTRNWSNQYLNSTLTKRMNHNSNSKARCIRLNWETWPHRF